MDDVMKKVIEDYFGEAIPENVNLACPTTLHDCIEIAKKYAAQHGVHPTVLCACPPPVSYENFICLHCGLPVPHSG